MLVAEQSNHRAGARQRTSMCKPHPPPRISLALLSFNRPTCLALHTYTYVCAIFISQRHNQGNASKHLSTSAIPSCHSHFWANGLTQTDSNNPICGTVYFSCTSILFSAFCLLIKRSFIQLFCIFHECNSISIANEFVARCCNMPKCCVSHYI